MKNYLFHSFEKKGLVIPLYSKKIQKMFLQYQYKTIKHQKEI